ncbi:MAG: CDP-alcohol phosphatidyltransferase family protein [Candidatus Limnocylindrales bacterium]
MAIDPAASDGARFRTSFRARVEPFARGLGRVGLTPNALTVIGFSIAAVGGALAGAQWWVAAGVISGVGAAFDMLDGALARATGTTSRLGAFMDSVFDRWGEALLYVGIVIGCTQAGYELGAWLAAAAMASAFMVSYTRAKSENLGFTPGTGMANVGLAPREVRVAITTVGLILSGLAGGPSADSGATGSLLLAATLGLITILATVTAIQRITHVMRQSKEQEIDR